MTYLKRPQIKALISHKEKVLGKGRYGIAYLVPCQGTTAVLKVSRDWNDHLQVFMDEADILRRLDGAGGTPTLLGYARYPPALLMTQVGSRSLYQLLYKVNTGFDLRELGIKAGYRLLEIHEKQIIHNDFKSDNIIISGTTEAPEVNIIDFGLACSQGKEVGLECDQSDFPWIAPEVTIGGPSTTASDVYSFGYLMSEILKHIPGDTSRSMDMVDMALRKEPRDRPSLKELLEHLKADSVK
ncbi:serine/threonine-protein kinase B-raf-like [Panulirus ornatus]|uniref:serine/threonine-protein kinase B-raf-like n=1 Tax=Panulirus ornatus TaxID=150431 RepID=UPI003A89CB4B